MTTKTLPPLKLADLVAIGVDEQVAADWLRSRKGPLTRTAWARHLTECEKAGCTPAQGVTFAAERSCWGFYADAYLRENPPARGARAGQPPAPQRPKSFDEVNREHRAGRMALLTGGRAPVQATLEGEDLRSAAEIMGATTNVRRLSH
jgi:hypothetical protein